MIRRFAIGIDPGKKTGIGVYCRIARALLDVRTTSGIFDAVNYVQESYAPDSCDVIVESTLNLPTFRSGENDAEQDRMARNVGMVQGLTDALIEALKGQGYNVKTVLPIRGGKLEAGRFRLLTHWQRPTDQHGRDAARLCWKSEWELDHRTYSIAEMRVTTLPFHLMPRGRYAHDNPPTWTLKVGEWRKTPMFDRIEAALAAAEKRAEGRIPLVVVRSKSGGYLDGFAVRHSIERGVFDCATLEEMKNREARENS